MPLFWYLAIFKKIDEIRTEHIQYRYRLGIRYKQVWARISPCMYEIMTIKCIEKQLKITRCFVCTSHLNKVGAHYTGLKSILIRKFLFLYEKWVCYILVWTFHENLVKMQMYENENDIFWCEYLMNNSWKCWSMKMRILFQWCFV